MSKSLDFESAVLPLIFQGTGIAGLADNDASSPLTNLYLSLHTADPGEGGDQTTNEVTYTSYARVAVPRSSDGFTITDNIVTLAEAVDFPTGTGGSGTATHFAVGTDLSGTGMILYSGTLDPAIVCGAGVTPQITNITITED
jgi:hypothetical protein